MEPNILMGIDPPNEYSCNPKKKNIFGDTFMYIFCDVFYAFWTILKVLEHFIYFFFNF